MNGNATEVGMKVPQAKNELGNYNNVADFFWNVPDYYKDGAVKAVNLTPANYTETLISPLKIKYQFAKDQQAGVQRHATDFTKLISAAGSELVATVDPVTGKLAYANTTASKKLLNEGTGTYNVYARVELVPTYGTCDLEFKEVSGNYLTVNFFKPVFAEGAEDYTVKPNGIDPTETPVAAIFTLKDAYSNDIIKYNATNQAVSDPYGIYNYYQISKVIVDLSQIEIVGIDFSVQGANTTDLGNGKYEIDATNVANLASNKIVTVYRNPAITKDKKVTIPVEIQHYWGSQNVSVEVTVSVNK
jgi:hypothetical protein